jgi:hypothetical protein
MSKYGLTQVEYALILDIIQSPYLHCGPFFGNLGEQAPSRLVTSACFEQFAPPINEHAFKSQLLDATVSPI